MTRTDIINKLIIDNDYRTYLEIGVNNAANIIKVNCEYKTGVDPEPQVKAYYPPCNIMTSNDFFKINKKKYDIIFIDGLHHAEQVYIDILNALEVLEEGGTIVCHDMKPRDYLAQKVPRVQMVWNGDCWRAFCQLRSESKGLKMFTIDTDEGCGVITKEANFVQPTNDFNFDFTYDEFVENQKEWLNLITVNEYLK